MNAEHPPEPERESPGPEDRQIDDMLDGRDIHQWPDQFGQVISYIHASLFEDYAKHDSKAIGYQGWHRRASWLAIGAGTIAILISLTGVVLESRGRELGISVAHGLSLWFLGAELVFFLIAVFVIIIAKWIYKFLETWLAERFCAEEYRSRKFRALLRSSLFCNPGKPWNERFAFWKAEFDDEVLDAKNRMTKAAGQCDVSDPIPPPPPDTAGCRFDDGFMRELVLYYQDKRLRTQIDYFDNRFDTLERQDNRFRKILGWGFTGSIVLVFLKLALDFFTSPENFRVPYVIIILVILFLPVIVFGIRTLRSSTEVARSASLYRANRNALEDFKNRLVVENSREPPDWEEMVKILWECENHLTRVNREWVRIMKEAEWFL